MLSAASLLSLWPALLNGFPVLMGDSFRYVSEAGGEPSWVSSQFYGYFLRAFRGSSLWLPIAGQAIAATLTVWLFLLRVAQMSEMRAAAATLGVSLFTPLPLFASLVMTDIWFGLGVLACLTLVWGHVPTWWERTWAGAVTAFAASAHPAALPLIAGIVIVGGLVAAVPAGRRVVGTGPAWAAISLAVALGALVVNNSIVWDRVSPNPHSAVVAFAYLYTLGDLDEQLTACEGTPACDLDAQPVANINGFNRFLFDSDGPLETTLGGPQQFAAEASTQVVHHVRDHPDEYVARVLHSARRQLTMTNAWGHVSRAQDRMAPGHRDRLGEYARGDAALLGSSRQYEGRLDLSWHTQTGRVLGALGVVATALVGATTLRARRRGDHATASAAGRLTAVLASLLLLYLVHAVLVGTTTFPAHRYGGRMLWLPGLGACAATAWAVSRARDRADVSRG